MHTFETHFSRNFYTEQAKSKNDDDDKHHFEQNPCKIAILHHHNSSMGDDFWREMEIFEQKETKFVCRLL